MTLQADQLIGNFFKDLSEPVVITGASGWLGRSTIEVIREHLTDDELVSKVVLAGSRERIEQFPGALSLKVHSLDKVCESNLKISGLVHLAFLTRDYVEKLPLDSYVMQNLLILKHAISLVRLSPNWVITVSSGAIFDQATGNLESDSFKNPYGFLKRVEEKIIADESILAGANSVHGRLWGASGIDMPSPGKYAIGSMALDLVNDIDIQVTSEHFVYRRYVDAREFMKISLAAAINGESITFDSGGPLVEMGELAQVFANQDSSKTLSVVRPPIDIDQDSDTYYPRGNSYESLAEKYGISILSIEEQCRNTILGIKTNFS
jgi:UDP-glucuronate decarboxylase